MATLLPVTAFAAGETPITEVSLTNSNIPETITSDMKITDAMQSAENVTCATEGCSITSVQWYISQHSDGTSGEEITPETVLGVGDTVCQEFVLEAAQGYAFDYEQIPGFNPTPDFNGTVTFNGKTASRSYIR